MQIRLLAFASAAEALGTDQLDFSWSPNDSASVGALKEELSRQHPQVALLWERLAVSVNGEIVADSEALQEGDEVALLPPVSGG